MGLQNFKNQINDYLKRHDGNYSLDLEVRENELEIILGYSEGSEYPYELPGRAESMAEDLGMEPKNAHSDWNPEEGYYQLIISES